MPFYCESIAYLRLDRQDDATPLPEGFDADAGEIGAGEFASFKLHVVTDDPRYFGEVTPWIEHRELRARARTARGSADVPGRFYYGGQGNNPLVYFAPRTVTAQDRLVILEFTFECTFGTWTTRPYLLTVRGSRSTPPSGPARNLPPATVRPEPTPPPLGLSPIQVGDCADLAVTVLADEEAVQGSTVSYTVRVTNLGPETSTDAAVQTYWPLGLWARSWTASLGSLTTRWPSRSPRFLPGPLASGASAEVVVTATALFGGRTILSAAQQTADCNPANDRGEAVLTVVKPPRPQLLGGWDGVRLTWARRGVQVRNRISGTLLVTNSGQADAGPSRALIVLSDSGDIFWRTEKGDRVLGSVDVPAVAAGAAVSVPVNFTHQSPNPPDRRYLLGLTDSGGAVYEAEERSLFKAAWAVLE
ncbi:MAG: hypothetical protein K0Q72_2477 [Armatimonadetes bacterium]|nr:hypothetical protein [Armatimonadota bacterium]